MRASSAAGLLLAGTLLAGGCTGPHTPFNVQNARAHIEQLAGHIGRRPSGTAANARAREYLIDQLRLYGYTVRVQEADARRPDRGVSGRVHNIIAFKAGTRPEAVGLVAHYDSRPQAPGAGDDGIGVAVCMETARLLAARQRLWSVLILLTDGEENGLLGAAAAVEDAEVLDRLKAYVNVESIGTAGPGVLFETGPGNAWMIDAWARSAPAPSGASYFTEIYKQLPNDTDFTILRGRGIPGLNLAAIGNSYVYHTALDTPERVTDGVLASLGDAVLSWVHALEERDIAQRATEPVVYFDVASSWAGAWRASVWRTIDIVALTLGVVGWLRLAVAAWRRHHVRGLIITLGWSIVGALAVAGGTIGVVALLRAVRELYHPWYAHPWRTFLLVALAGVAIGWILFRLAAHLPAAVRLARDPRLFWLPALAVWIAVGAALVWLAPAAAYLWTLPAGCAGLLLALSAGRDRLIAVASWAIALVAAVLVLPDTIDILTFAAPALGRLPFVTPAAVPAALVLLPALFIAPPLMAALAGSGYRRPRFLTRALIAATVFAFAWAYFTEAYTAERPERRSVRYTADVAAGKAYWEVAGLEPGLVFGGAAPAGWRASGREHPLGDPFTPLRAPFSYIAPGAPTAPPAEASYRVAPAGGGRISVEIDVRPSIEGLWATLLMPPGVEPVESSFPGVTRRERWAAAYAAVPLEGVTFAVVLPSDAEPRFPELRVLVESDVPGAVTPGNGPGWLPEGRIAWTGWALHLLPVPPAAPGGPREPLGPPLAADPPPPLR